MATLRITVPSAALPPDSVSHAVTRPTIVCNCPVQRASTRRQHSRIDSWRRLRDIRGSRPLPDAQSRSLDSWFTGEQKPSKSRARM